MTAETPDLPEQEQLYSEEARTAALETLRSIMGEPSPEMLQVVADRDEEIAARRAHAA
ncbi:hypothetical protein ACGFJC_47300 [Nonomuraea fuscirosea]|uniref:hypothetical protein n=1 Tax=Nonomuraea fuscirosea TaxID=1291556 RepID=UPI0037247B94